MIPNLEKIHLFPLKSEKSHFTKSATSKIGHLKIDHFEIDHFENFEQEKCVS